MTNIELLNPPFETFNSEDFIPANNNVRMIYSLMDRCRSLKQAMQGSKSVKIIKARDDLDKEIESLENILLEMSSFFILGTKGEMGRYIKIALRLTENEYRNHNERIRAKLRNIRFLHELNLDFNSFSLIDKESRE